MSKKPIHYMMLSGWLPIPYSQWTTTQCLWVGSVALNTDQFYNSCKIIADSLNNGVKRGNIKRNITGYLKKSGIKRDNKFCGFFFDDAFQMVNESWEIQKYIIKNYV